MQSSLRREFFIEGTHHGAGSQELFSGNHGEAPTSHAFFCPDPDCGRIWAIAPVAGRRWQVWHQVCARQHGDDLEAYRDTPQGSVWLSWDDGYLASMPEAVLRRELELLCNQLERNNGD